MKYVVPEAIQKLVPYSPGKPIAETKRQYGLERVVKLASNENPLGPSPKALEAIQRDLFDLHRYPDAAFYELRQGFSEYLGVSAEKITFGNGSNELIDHLIRIFCSEGRGVLTSEKAFIAYKISAKVAGCPFFEMPLSSDYRFDILRLIQKIEQDGDQLGLVFLPNPNNPTGTYINESEMVSLMTAVKKHPHLLVVLDEAYAEFVDAEDAPQGLNWLRNESQLCLLRTLSKVFGLAGLRVGALVGQAELIGLVDRVRNPFNVNSLAQSAALATLGDREYLKRVIQVNREGKLQIEKGLALLGLHYVPSQANFVFFDSERPAEAVFEALLHKGVIIRPLINYGFKTQLRVSVGLREENELFLTALKQVLETVGSIAFEVKKDSQ